MTGALQIYIGKAIQYSEEHGTDKAVVMTIAFALCLSLCFALLFVLQCNLFRQCTHPAISFFKCAIVYLAVGSKAEGIIETGLDVGLSEQDILERLQKKLDISLQKAQEYVSRFGKRTV